MGTVHAGPGKEQRSVDQMGSIWTLTEKRVFQYRFVLLSKASRFFFCWLRGCAKNRVEAVIFKAELTKGTLTERAWLLDTCLNVSRDLWIFGYLNVQSEFKE